MASRIKVKKILSGIPNVARVVDITQIANVNDSALANDGIFVYDSAAQEFVFETVLRNLTELQDIEDSGLTNLDILRYDSDTGKFKFQPLATTLRGLQDVDDSGISSVNKLMLFDEATGTFKFGSVEAETGVASVNGLTGALTVDAGGDLKRTLLGNTTTFTLDSIDGGSF
jgi:hypothetical protein